MIVQAVNPDAGMSSGGSGSESRRTTRRLVLLFATPATVVAAAVVAMVWFGSEGFEWAWLGFPTAGAIILLNRPGNPVGRAMMAVGVAIAVQFAAGFAGVLGYGGAWPSWVGAWGLPAAFLLLAVFPAVFPDGPSSPRWRVAIRSYLAYSAFLVVYYAIRPGPLPALPDSPTFDNPVGISALAPLRDSSAEHVAGWLAFAFAIAAVLRLVVRWYRSSGVERLQFRWLGLALGVLALLALGGNVLPPINPAFDAVGLWGLILGLNGIAAAVLFAIVRYRLYEIDRIVSRTITYGLVIAVLAAVYVALVAASTRLLPSQNDVAVAASTLVIAYLFTPARRRVQRVIDRRFNRMRYEADREVESLGRRMRDVTDPAAVQSDVVDAIHQTLQPSTVSMWVRPVRNQAPRP